MDACMQLRWDGRYATWAMEGLKGMHLHKPLPLMKPAAGSRCCVSKPTSIPKPSRNALARVYPRTAALCVWATVQPSRCVGCKADVVILQAG
eukprot:scaffold33126_cov20-Tisochrysis_lutea.AAC.4